RALKAAGKEAGDEAAVREARDALDDAERAVPPLPRVLADDATPEALVRLLADHGRIAVVAAEGDVLRIVDGRYARDGAARLGELTRAWSGDPIRVDRIGREPVHVPRPALTLALAVQPSVVPSLAH